MLIQLAITFLSIPKFKFRRRPTEFQIILGRLAKLSQKFYGFLSSHVQKLYKPSENPLRINKRSISRNESFFPLKSQVDDQEVKDKVVELLHTQCRDDCSTNKQSMHAILNVDNYWKIHLLRKLYYVCNTNVIVKSLIDVPWSLKSSKPIILCMRKRANTHAYQLTNKNLDQIDSYNLQATYEKNVMPNYLQRYTWPQHRGLIKKD